uniref:ZP domain-containing protein n=1 Tax=Lates calcarifer TaxID=8187 RepID=A0A4W6EI79_LATCA
MAAASLRFCVCFFQNDEVFTFRFNVIVSDGSGGWLSHLVSEVCSGLIWTHREIICEEDYMEVRTPTPPGRTASSVWQLMFLQSDGQVSSMSISEAQNRGYSLTTTAQRVVLRSSYKQSHAQVITVGNHVHRHQSLTVVMIDMSMACSFDGAWLLWDIPWVMTPLVERVATFESRSLGVGVEGVLLDEPTATTRGFSLVQQGRLVQIGVPFGAEGGYWKERYMIFVLYEHIFSLLYEDGSSIDTRHRMLRELDTPLLCRPPFSLDQTISDDQVFSIYLGNIPADVILEEVWINRKQLMIAESIKGGISISPVVHANGSRAYKLQLPFEDNVVHWMYSIDINFTLTIMPQRDSYHHHTSITAQVFDAFPPEITAQCSDGGIAFSVVRPPRAKSLWEVGVNHEPLTSQLAAQRGYHLHNDAHKTTLEVPVFSIGYTYEGINLANFYGTFKLLLRDSKTLEVQTSTSKRCLFKTEDMMVCSADGTMTVVTTLTSTWPMVQPERTSLLDPTCEPKQVDGSRVLFEFKVDSLRCFYPLSGVNRLSVDRIFRSETPGFGSIKVFESLKGHSLSY